MSLCVSLSIVPLHTCQPVYVVPTPAGMMWTIYDGGCEPPFYRSSEVIWSTSTSRDDAMPTFNYFCNRLLLLDYIYTV